MPAILCFASPVRSLRISTRVPIISVIGLLRNVRALYCSVRLIPRVCHPRRGTQNTLRRPIEARIPIKKIRQSTAAEELISEFRLHGFIVCSRCLRAEHLNYWPKLSAHTLCVEYELMMIIIIIWFLFFNNNNYRFVCAHVVLYCYFLIIIL